MILHGDCLIKLGELEDNSIDAIVTDPPYGLKFMGKNWDYNVPSVGVWIEAMRVLKPGGHLLAFGGTRTYHRLVVNIEDAGFEIRDQVQWIYGSGFPKSHNLKDEWQGWGTALKPANEPIVLARKPLEKGMTIAQNVLKWGTGALNIDESRIGTEVIQSRQIDTTAWHGNNFGAKPQKPTGEIKTYEGRWPANVILDEQAAFDLDEQSGVLKSGAIKKDQYSNGKKRNVAYGEWGGFTLEQDRQADSGGASRFFYVAKASKRERGTENIHPTVKPIKLMEYLIKLITPPKGTVLDPFAGSGSTGVAAKKLGFKFIGIEREKEYVEIAQRRIEAS